MPYTHPPFLKYDLKKTPPLPNIHTNFLTQMVFKRALFKELRKSEYVI